MMPNANMQFYFDPDTILLNARTDQMLGTVAPTDTRYRKDIQLFENGQIDEADKEKVKIEKR